MGKIIAIFIFFTQLYLVGQTLQGPNNPASSSTFSCTFSYGSNVPYTPSNAIYASDNTYATASHCACCDQNTNCLFATNFGFSIPSGAIITGIRVEIEKGTNSSDLQDNGLRLLKNNVEVGNDYAQFGTPWQLTDTYSTYGGCSDLWGTTWTPSDINSPNFGLAFTSIDYSCSGNVSSRIDHVRITICYTIVLPISLEYFFGSRSNETVNLTWKISSNEVLSSMVIEYAADGLNFEAIQTILPNARQTNENLFSFIHSNTNESTSYYRLKMYQNGKANYSNSISVKPYIQKASKVFPNPSDGFVTLKSTIGDAYFLFNTFGEILAKGYVTEKEFKVDFSNFPNGIYVLKLDGGHYKLEIRH